jgi:hypothetical protein
VLTAANIRPGRPERLTVDKRSSLFSLVVTNDGGKSFIATTPKYDRRQRCCHNTEKSRDMHVIVDNSSKLGFEQSTTQRES